MHPSLTESSVIQKSVITSTDVKSSVVSAFGADSVMVEIARCESHFRQFDKNGNVLRGEINKQDVGIFEINEYYHLKESKRLGYDIYTIEGNIGYARYTYDKQGTRPWNWSKPCWGK